jgi:hypothetical protein
MKREGTTMKQERTTMTQEGTTMKTFARLTIMGVAALVTASCATSQAPPLSAPTVNVTGPWVGTWACDRGSTDSDGRAGMVSLTATQTGAQVTGQTHSTNPAFNRMGTFQATVSGNQIYIDQAGWSGRMEVTGDKIAGTFKGVCTGTLALHRTALTGTLERSRLLTLVATVESIDQANRMVTLRGPKGNSVTLEVDPSVKNLPQLAVGDTINVAYYESWALQLDKPGEAGGSIIATAPAVQMPAGYNARRTTTVVATVEAIDASKPSVTFKGPQGGSMEVMVSDDPRALARLKVGDTYNVSYTQALAVAVEKASK